MYILRDAIPADVPRLYAAERLVVEQFDGLLVSEPEEIAESSFLEKLGLVAGGKGRYLVALADDQLVGHACLWPMSLKKVSHVLRLDMCIHVGALLVTGFPEKSCAQVVAGGADSAVQGLTEWVKTASRAADTLKKALLARSGRTLALIRRPSALGGRPTTPGA